MATILDTIVEQKRREVSELRAKGIVVPPAYLEQGIDAPRGFRQALLDYPGVSVIAEVKKASPSKGIISEDFEPVQIAKNYQKRGAQAISVLTDEKFFQGALSYMLDVRSAVELPVLRKDFIIDELQVEESSKHGADCILLIVSILDPYQLRDYRVYAKELGMDVLVEVHDEYEAEQAMKAEADLIGVNNRNLKDFSVDLETTFRVRRMIPAGIPVVSESGIKTREHFQRLAEENIAAALVGETLMRAGADSDLLETIRQG